MIWAEHQYYTEVAADLYGYDRLVLGGDPADLHGREGGRCAWDGALICTFTIRPDSPRTDMYCTDRAPICTVVMAIIQHRTAPRISVATAQISVKRLNHNRSYHTKPIAPIVLQTGQR